MIRDLPPSSADRVRSERLEQRRGSPVSRLDQQPADAAQDAGDAYAHEEEEDRRRGHQDRAAFSCPRHGWGGDVTTDVKELDSG